MMMQRSTAAALLSRRRMLSVGSMFARRAAASEGSHARDEAKAMLRKRRERLEREGKLDSTAASNSKQHTGVTVDVLAEISAMDLPLGAPSAHHAEPLVHDVSVPPPDPKLGTPQLPSQSAVAAEIYRNSGMTYAGRNDWASMMKSAIAPSNMLATQQDAMAQRLGRPLREREKIKMIEEARASALASVSVLVGTIVCCMGATLAGVFVWRRYGRPKTREEVGAAAEQLQRQQQERERQLRAVVGPVASQIKLSAGAAVTESESLQNFADGLKHNRGTRYVPPTR